MNDTALFAARAFFAPICREKNQSAGFAFFLSLETQTDEEAGWEFTSLTREYRPTSTGTMLNSVE